MGNLQESVDGILRNLRNLDGLKELFRSQLNYDLLNLPIPRQDWPQGAADSLADDPLLLAGHGDFHVIYGRLQGSLRITPERTIVNRLLREHPYALFVFSDDQQLHWHFVNVKLAVDRDDEKNRNEKRRRLFRRIAIGPEERLRTAMERLSLLDLEAISSGKLFISPLDVQQAHDDAFDVEKVTDQFFRDYQAATQILQKDLFDQTKDKTWAHGYALQFLNRLMFLYFIQRKRWLGNNPKFMEDFWKGYQDSGQTQNTFFNKWLRVLFFEAFNNKFHGGHTQFPQEIRDALALAPHLNGGLFQENGLDRKTGFTISDRRFEQIFTFLEGYNFTITEDSPLDQEVAVDPEMIGKVYESLVNVSTELDTRGDAGIFYTPRTEIDLMCRLALVDNLANHLGEDQKNLFYELVFALMPDEKEDADRKITAAALWGPIEKHLQALTVLDPACGSGSFLVGMLHILDDLQVRASRQLGKTEDPYERRKRIIGQSLYGVDVMEWACRVAELRLWLALIIDAEFTKEELHVRTEPLLPNFTFNIRPGDSLVQEVGGINLGHRRATLEIPPALKARITRLKTEKLKFYRNEPDRQFRTADQAKHEELRLFRDILDHHQHGLKNRAAQLRQMMAGTQWRLDGTKEAAPKRAEWERELDEVNTALADLEQAQEALRDRTELPFVWDIAFVEIFEGEGHGFDIVIGNPPYVRQENISDPTFPRELVTTENKKNYKAKLARSVYQAFPNFFKFKAQAEAPGRKLDAKSDLYIYFYLHGLSLLNRQGSFCFITSNSWLDVGYGKDLQEFLLKHAHIKFILDNRARRSFAAADVNTIIALFSGPNDRTDWGLKQTARFVMFQVPFEEILSPVIFEEIEETQDKVMTPEYRIFPKLQKELWEEGLEAPEGEPEDETTHKKGRKPLGGPLIKVAHYIGNKWGGKYLRAPNIFFTLMTKGKDLIRPLSDFFDGERYLNTGGADGFFILNKVKPSSKGFYHVLNSSCLNQPGTPFEGEIEDNYLVPLIKDYTKSNKFIEIHGYDAYCVVIKDKPSERITKYIKWGELQGYHMRSVTRSQRPWYKPTNQMLSAAKILFPRSFNDSFVINYNPHLYLSLRFYRLHPKNAKDINLAAYLNSTFMAFIIETLGNKSLGQDVLDFFMADFLALKIPVFLGDELQIPFKMIKERSILNVWDEYGLSKTEKKKSNEIILSEDRKSLDNVIFDALSLTQNEREAVYEELINMVAHRIEKASSLKPKERVKRVAAAEKTLGIWSEIPEELFEEE